MFPLNWQQHLVREGNFTVESDSVSTGHHASKPARCQVLDKPNPQTLYEPFSLVDPKPEASAPRSQIHPKPQTLLQRQGDRETVVKLGEVALDSKIQHLAAAGPLSLYRRLGKSAKTHGKKKTPPLNSVVALRFFSVTAALSPCGSLSRRLWAFAGTSPLSRQCTELRALSLCRATSSAPLLP